MKRTSFSARFVKIPARSPFRSSAGPEVTWICEPSSWAITCASEVLPRPGGRPHGIGLGGAPARETDAAQRVPQQRPGDSLAPKTGLDEEAGDAPDVRGVVAGERGRPLQLGEIHASGVGAPADRRAAAEGKDAAPAPAPHQRL